MAGAVVIVSADVCLWCGEANLSLPHLVGSHCSPAPLPDTGTHAAHRGAQQCSMVAASTRYTTISLSPSHVVMVIPPLVSSYSSGVVCPPASRLGSKVKCGGHLLHRDLYSTAVLHTSQVTQDSDLPGTGQLLRGGAS